MPAQEAFLCLVNLVNKSLLKTFYYGTKDDVSFFLMLVLFDAFADLHLITDGGILPSLQYSLSGPDADSIQELRRPRHSAIALLARLAHNLIQHASWLG